MIQNLITACLLATASVITTNEPKDTNINNITTAGRQDTFYLLDIGSNTEGVKVFNLNGTYKYQNNDYIFGGVIGLYDEDNYSKGLSTYFTFQKLQNNLSNVKIKLYYNVTYNVDILLANLKTKQENLANMDEEYLGPEVLDQDFYYLSQDSNTDDIGLNYANADPYGYTGETTLVEQYIQEFSINQTMADGVARVGAKNHIFDQETEGTVYVQLKYIQIEYTLVYGDVEYIDIPGLMFTILGMPFSFISQAFDLTLFPGTQYAINVANILFAIITSLIIIVIIKKVLK